MGIGHAVNVAQPFFAHLLKDLVGEELLVLRSGNFPWHLAGICFHVHFACWGRQFSASYRTLVMRRHPAGGSMDLFKRQTWRVSPKRSFEGWKVEGLR